MPTLRDRRTASTSRSTAVGIGTTVSSRTQIQSGPVSVEVDEAVRGVRSG
jgi:hypothetical protein